MSQDYPDCMERLSATEYKCKKLGFTIKAKTLPIRCTACTLNVPADVIGPGTETKAMLLSIGIREKPACGCEDYAQQMDEWGVAGCREHFDEIVQRFRSLQAEYGWGDKLKAASLAAMTGLAFRLNWLDPFPSLVEEAIRRAERKEVEMG